MNKHTCLPDGQIPSWMSLNIEHGWNGTKLKRGYTILWGWTVNIVSLLLIKSQWHANAPSHPLPFTGRKNELSYVCEGNGCKQGILPNIEDPVSLHRVCVKKSIVDRPREKWNIQSRTITNGFRLWTPHQESELKLLYLC